MTRMSPLTFREKQDKLEVVERPSEGAIFFPNVYVSFKLSLIIQVWSGSVPRTRLSTSFVVGTTLCVLGRPAGDRPTLPLTPESLGPDPSP